MSQFDQTQSQPHSQTSNPAAPATPPTPVSDPFTPAPAPASAPSPLPAPAPASAPSPLPAPAPVSAPSMPPPPPSTSTQTPGVSTLARAPAPLAPAPSTHTPPITKPTVAQPTPTQPAPSYSPTPPTSPQPKAPASSPNINPATKPTIAPPKPEPVTSASPQSIPTHKKPAVILPPAADISEKVSPATVILPPSISQTHDDPSASSQPFITQSPATISAGTPPEELKNLALIKNLNIKKFAFASVLLILAGLMYFGYQYWLFNHTPTDDDILLTSKYENATWKSYGEVFEPIVEVPIHYPDGSYKDQEFLLDSGAVVSSLPREKAEELGYSLAMLPRITFAGFGGTSSFAYQADIQMKLKDEEIELPVVFTEAAGTKPILGRSGFFDTYSVNFDSRTETIEITK